MLEASSVMARLQAFRVIRWWATRCRLTLATWRLRPSTLHAHTTRPYIIPALKNIQDDKPKEKEVQPLPSLFDGGILQPFEVGAGNELEPKTSPPMTRTTRRTSRLAAYVIPEVYEPP